MISFECRGCGHPFRVGEEFAGKLARCKKCGEKTQILPDSGPDELGLEMLATKSPAPAQPLPRSVYRPTPASKQDERPKPASKKKSKAGSGGLIGPGGYQGDHLRHLVWIGIVVAFFLFRVFVKTSIRNDMRDAAAKRQAEEQP